MRETEDEKLKSYREFISGKHGLSAESIPSFGKEASSVSSIVILLKNPEKIDPGKSGIVSLRNDNPVSQTLRDQADRVDINIDKIVFWNLFSAYDIKRFDKKSSLLWVESFSYLVSEMSNLHSIVACGESVWSPLFNLSATRFPTIIPCAEPSVRGLAKEEGRESLIRAWDSLANIQKGRPIGDLKGLVAGAQEKVKNTISKLDEDKIRSIATKVEGSLKSTVREIEKTDINGKFSKVKEGVKDLWDNAWREKPRKGD